MKLFAALLGSTPHAGAAAIQPPAIVAEVLEEARFVTEAPKPAFQLQTDAIDAAGQAYEAALGAGFGPRAAMARALEAIAFSDLPDLVSGPNAKRVNQKAKRKAQRALLALAETAFEEEPLF